MERHRSCVLLCRNVSLASPELREFVAEAVLMADLKPHPHVVAFLGICLEPLCIVVEVGLLRKPNPKLIDLCH